ncbi:amidohydrolase family protein [Streptomyces sp. NPDC058417]|uniref:amidohydrolase family protein n=1 Tax=unclassified Streptomyces TaxID=2593676 RepID=UPI00364A3E65
MSAREQDGGARGRSGRVQGAKAPLIDTHAHFVTDYYVACARQAGIEHPDAMPGWPTWSAREHMRLMDCVGIDRAILSISSPGVHFGDDDQARALAGHVNDAAAEIVAKHPHRFGFFASLPLPDVGASLSEIGRASQLGADGFVVETSAGGVYLADPDYEPVWSALNERRAVVFVHPTSPPGAERTDQGLPRPMLEFIFDTTRAFTGLIANGVLTRHPDIRWIVSHGGAALPLLADRIQYVLDVVGRTREGFATPQVREQLRHLWYDTAGFPVPAQLPLLLETVDRSRVLYGSDYCWTPPAPVRTLAGALDGFFNARGEDWRAEFARNGAALMAR